MAVMNRSRSLRLFGLTEPVDPADLKQVYRRLAFRWHPDRPLNQLPFRRKWAQKRMRRINVARDILTAEPTVMPTRERSPADVAPKRDATPMPRPEPAFAAGRAAVNPVFLKSSRDGDTWWKMGRLDRALAAYNDAIRIYPRSAAALNNRALIHRAMGRYIKALSDLNRAVRIAPTLISARINRGDVLVALGRFAEAVADYDRAVAMDPTIAYTYRQRGMARHRLGDSHQAQSDLHQAHELALAGSHR